MRYIKIFAGNLLMAMAYSFITVPNDIVNGGVTSLAMICAELLGVDVALCSNLFTILLMVICAVFLGKSYFMGTVCSCVMYMTMFTLFSMSGISLHIFPPAAALIAAVMVGTGYFFMYKRQVDRDRLRYRGSYTEQEKSKDKYSRGNVRDKYMCADTGIFYVWSHECSYGDIFRACPVLHFKYHNTFEQKIGIVLNCFPPCIRSGCAAIFFIKRISYACKR